MAELRVYVLSTIVAYMFVIFALVALSGCASPRDMPQDEVNWIVKNAK